MPGVEHILQVSNALVSDASESLGLFSEHPVVQGRNKPQKSERFIREFEDDVSNMEPDFVHDL